MQAQAKDLNQMFLVFDPMEPLTGFQLKDYYIDREKNPTNRLKNFLLSDPMKNDKILFAGHRGCGKSTELNKLSEDIDLNRDLFIVHYSVEKVLDPLDIDYIDILFSLEAMIYQSARTRNIRLKDDLLKYILEFWIGRTSEVGFIEREPKRPTEETLDSFYKELVGSQGKLRIEPSTREFIRKNIAQRISNIIEHINLLSTAIRLESKKRNILAIIDGLDKPDLRLAQEVFYHRATSITQPSCKIIYTIPIALLYQSEFRSIERNFHHKFILPNIKIYDKTGGLYKDGYEKLKSLVNKRISPELIEEESLEVLISKSGGVLREITLLVRIACNIAKSQGRVKIDLESSKQAISEIRNDYRKSLRKEHYQELIKLHQTKDIREIHTKLPKEEDIESLVLLELLHNLSVLEYSNDEDWWDIHPIVLDLIKEGNGN